LKRNRILILYLIFCFVIILNIIFNISNKSNIDIKDKQRQYFYEIQNFYFENYNKLINNKLIFGDTIPDFNIKDIYNNNINKDYLKNRLTLFIFLPLNNDYLASIDMLNRFAKKYNNNLNIILLFYHYVESNDFNKILFQKINLNQNLKIVFDNKKITQDIFKVPCNLCGYEILVDKNYIIRLSTTNIDQKNLDIIIERYL